jgi:hypothetical protein
LQQQLPPPPTNNNATNSDQPASKTTNNFTYAMQNQQLHGQTGISTATNTATNQPANQPPSNNQQPNTPTMVKNKSAFTFSNPTCCVVKTNFSIFKCLNFFLL